MKSGDVHEERIAGQVCASGSSAVTRGSSESAQQALLFFINQQKGARI